MIRISKKPLINLPVLGTVLAFSLFGRNVVALAADEASHVRPSIYSDSKSIAPGRPFWVAVRLDMQDGWHTYWKNQGDSGLPTKIDWTLPADYQADPFLWPAPQKFGDSNITNYGYDSEVIFLTKITPPATAREGETAAISAKISWMECAELCIPGNAKLDLSLPVRAVQAPAEPQHAEVFARAKLRMPRASAGWYLRARHYRNKITLTVVPPPGTSLAEAYFFPEAAGQLDAGAPQKFSARPKSYALELWCGTSFKQNSRRLKGVMTFKHASGNPGAINVSIPISR